jgi:PAS domain S-box-containing protein
MLPPIASRRRAMLGLGLALALLLTVSIVTVWKWLELRSARKNEAQIREALIETESLISTIADAENSEYEYLLLADTRYVEAYKSAIQPIRTLFNQIARADLPRPGRTLIEQLRSAADVHIRQISRVIEIRRRGNVAEALNVLSNEDKQAHETIRHLGLSLLRLENSALQEQVARATYYARLAALLPVAGCVCALLLLLFTRRKIDQAFGSREKLIEELSQSQKEVQQSKDLFETTLTSIGDAVIATDDQGRVAFMNPLASQLTGWNWEEALGRELNQVFHAVNESTGARTQTSPNEVADTSPSGKLIHEAVLTSRDGRHTPIDESAAPILDRDAQLRGAVLVFPDAFGRKKAERQLMESEQLYRFLFDNNPEPMWVYDLETLRFLAVNASAVQTYLFTRDEFLSLTIADIRPHSEVPRLMRGLEQNAFSGRLRSGPWCHKRKDGSTLDVEIISQSITYRGNPARFVIAVDITERKRVQDALREAEERLRLAVESAGLGIWSYDLRTSTLVLSERGKQMFGLPAVPEPTYDDVLGSLPPDSREIARRAIREAINDPARPTFSARFRCGSSDSSERRLSLRGRAYFESTNQVYIPARLVGTLLDVTERVRAEEEREAILAREKQSRHAAELSNRVGLLLSTELNQNRLVQAITEISTQLTGADFGAFCETAPDGIAPEEARYVFSGSPPEICERLPQWIGPALLYRTFAEGSSVRIDDISSSANGAEPSAAEPNMALRSFLAIAVRSRTGGVLGALVFGHGSPGIFSDREEQLAVGMASQAGIAFDNARLVESLRRERIVVEEHVQQLAQTNADLKQFAYSASHDLQEPLRTVSLHSQLLQMKLADLGDETVAEALRFVRQSAIQMDALVRDLLTYTQIIAEEKQDFGVISSEEVAHEVLENLQPVLEKIKASVTLGSLPTVKIRRWHLQQLFQNLIENALKYRGERNPEVCIRAERQNSFLLFTIQDNGIGIDPRYSDQILGMFKRLHGHAFPGTGMGLAICKRIVERYSGRIWVTSAAGQGAAFQFQLPVHAALNG